MSGILGKKVGMTHIYTDTGVFVPVTVLEVGPCSVIQKKTKETDSYNAIQIGFGDKKESRATKAERGHFAKSNVALKQFVREIRLDEKEIDSYEVAQEIKADIFSEGDFVDISAISKGKGFAGVIKRHNFAGGPASHGSRFHRAPGSIGQCAWPARVFKGKKLPGQMGNKNVTVQSIKVVKVDAEKNLLLVKGAVPGAKNAHLVIKKAVKKK